ncbi:kinesin-like protein 2 [Exaiptasia diaphana]|uniref:Uncharacterized protein n=1 Tax=Exaiptasia diaphana TaxID=2652724 RepID=A0A913YX64_EXADI|nr:kinesin-like protein 2 [Exaiptasia diaphana]
MARDKHTEIVKLRLEYDAKLLKLQKSSAAKTQSAPSSHFNSDIFRKKLQAAKSESEREIAALKERIAQLERQLSMASQTQHDFRSSSLSLKRRRFNQN